MDALTQRNFHAMSEGLKDVRQKLVDAEANDKKKNAIITELNSKVIMLEQRVNIMFAKSMGSGSTE